MIDFLGYAANDPNQPDQLTCLGPVYFASALKQLAPQNNWQWVDTLYPREITETGQLDELAVRLGLHIQQLISQDRRFAVIGGGAPLHTAVKMALASNTKHVWVDVCQPVDAQLIDATGQWIIHAQIDTDIHPSHFDTLRAHLDAHPPIGIALSNVSGDPDQRLTKQLIDLCLK